MMEILIGMAGGAVVLAIILAGLWFVMRWDIRSEAERKYPSQQRRRGS